MKGRKDRDYRRFEGLTFEDFKRLAVDPSLSRHEKIGFPNDYREGYEEAIFEDIVLKIGSLSQSGKTLMDLGCGCSGLAFMIIKQCQKTGNTLLMVDSDEMLSMLPDKPFIKKYPCRFPDCPELLDEYFGRVDGILVYSVLQHVFLDGNIFDFIDRACELLADGGELLLGDIPNISKRKRFFSSDAGIKFHREFMGTDETPRVDHLVNEPGKIDDGVVFGIMQRYRAFGFDTYLLPQNPQLPFANRREDVLISKP